MLPGAALQLPALARDPDVALSKVVAPLETEPLIVARDLLRSVTGESEAGVIGAQEQPSALAAAQSFGWGADLGELVVLGTKLVSELNRAVARWGRCRLGEAHETHGFVF